MAKRTFHLEDVKVQFGRIKPIVQGVSTSLKYSLTNTSEGYLVFSPGEIRYGNISVRGDHLVYNTMAQMATGPVFFRISKPLAPKKSRTKTITIRYFQPGKVQKRVMFAYIKIDEVTVSNLFISDKAPSKLPETQQTTTRSILTAVPTRSTEITYRRLDDMDEFLAKTRQDTLEVVIPDTRREGLQKLLDFTLELDVEPNPEFQELYEKYKPQDLIDLETLGYTALATKRGTILLRDGKATHIGNVGLAALKRIAEKEEDPLLIWVRPTTGPITELLEKHGEANQDHMYHGRFPHILRLPKSALLEFFRCVKKGKYQVAAGHGMFYEQDIWVLEEE